MRKCPSVWLVLAASSAMAQLPPETNLMVNPDSSLFQFCYSSDCTDSLSFSLYEISVDTIIDYSTNTITSSTVLADLSTIVSIDNNNDGFLDPTIVETSPDDATALTTEWTNATFYARACLSTMCTSRSSNESEFQGLLHSRADALGVKLDVGHLWTASSIPSEYESYDVARGALRLNLSVAVSPRADQPDVLPMFGISFLVAAMNNRTPSTNVSIETTVDGHMYLHRVYFGDDMFMELPMYSKVNDVDMMIYTAVNGHTSGVLQDLVQITLMFGPVQHSVGYVTAFSSHTLVDEGGSRGSGGVGSVTMPPSSLIPSPSSPSPSTPAPSFVNTFDTPLNDSTGHVLSTRMVTASQGAFGLCLNSTCTTGDIVAMNFAGLRVSGSVDLRINQFATSPALQFSPPTSGTLTGSTTTEVVSSSFKASVPFSRIRPVLPYDSRSTDPSFLAHLDYFLTPGNVTYGGKTIAVPRGAIKFFIEIDNWVFPSPSDKLELRMAVSFTHDSVTITNITAATNVTNLGDTVVLQLDHNKSLEFPTYAVADGNVVPVGVAVAPQDKAGSALIVTFTFASFSQKLVYDPVIKALNTTNSTPIHLEKLKRKVDSWAITGFLLGFLALVIIVSILQCIKKSRVKLELSKIIP